MKQNPSKLKYKKNHKPSFSNLYLAEQKSFNSIKGNLILKSLENGKLTYNQIEACRKTIRRILKKQGKVYLRVFTNISITLGSENTCSASDVQLNTLASLLSFSCSSTSTRKQFSLSILLSIATIVSWLFNKMFQ